MSKDECHLAAIKVTHEMGWSSVKWDSMNYVSQPFWPCGCTINSGDSIYFDDGSKGCAKAKPDDISKWARLVCKVRIV